MELVLAFLSGMFLTNSIPHIVSGIQGNKHMTPVSKDSSAINNVLWGFVNLVVGALIYNYSGASLDRIFAFDAFSISFMLGALALALTAAWLFSNPNAKFPWFK